MKAIQISDAKTWQRVDSCFTWNATNVAPKWLDPHGESCDKEEAAVRQALDAARSGEQKAKSK